MTEPRSTHVKRVEIGKGKETNVRPDIIPGVVILMHYGPYQATATVLEVAPIGIVVRPNDDAKLVGYRDILHAPNGAMLTQDVMHDFIGNAHLHNVTVVES